LAISLAEKRGPCICSSKLLARESQKK